MTWFRFSSVVFAAWAALFFFFPRFANEFAAIGSVPGKHAEDWTRIVGLFSLALAIALDRAHRSTNAQVRQTVARVVLSFTLPCAVLMIYWQLIPDRRWIRLDIANIVLLCLVSAGVVWQGGLWKRHTARPDRQ